MTELEPMTDAELAAVRELARDFHRTLPRWVPALLARLDRAEAAGAWREIDDDCRKGGSWLLTDSPEGGWMVEGFWDADEYDEFRGEYRYCWNYGPAEIDGTNFRPTHYRPLPAPPALARSEREG